MSSPEILRISESRCSSKLQLHCLFVQARDNVTATLTLLIRAKKDRAFEHGLLCLSCLKDSSDCQYLSIACIGHNNSSPAVGSMHDLSIADI